MENDNSTHTHTQDFIAFGVNRYVSVRSGEAETEARQLHDNNVTFDYRKTKTQQQKFIAAVETTTTTAIVWTSYQMLAESNE